MFIFTRCFMRVNILIGLIFFSPIFSSPDVFFIDSDAYNGDYLSHQFMNNNFDWISFRFPTAIAGINLHQDSWFNCEQLKNYIKHHHQFSSPALRREMLFMMGHSFYSSFRARPFLQELTRILDGYLAQQNMQRGGQD
jgi:hypothetical protein